ncbi:hypothetical protein SAMN05444285_14519 [Draconibacterium orientale]|uniref:Uncharacterized protein n=1 Tax=Draconibacterium orientale TaxID=1168034 RepID=A0A1I0JLW5_9BACT|nr:hypothetical protein SAMN05444285_14519 [Draconibacterium orientale]
MTGSRLCGIIYHRENTERHREGKSNVFYVPNVVQKLWVFLC